jgi:hypothetical protein
MRSKEQSLIRAIRGPITLITIGVLFVLQNFTRYGFDQTWPVILIVFGLLSLLGRRMEPAPPPPGPVPFGGYPPAGGYSQTPYAQSPYAQSPAAPTTPAGASKGGFGTSAPPRSSDPGQGGDSGGAA